jgi:hypothetical protein
MKKKAFPITGIMVMFVALVLVWAEHSQETRPRKLGSESDLSKGSIMMNPEFGKIPLYFIPNQGQVHEQAKFYAKTSRYTLWLTKEGLVFDTTKKTEVRGQKSVDKGHRLGAIDDRQKKLKLNTQNSKLKTKVKRDVSKLIFMGANKNPEISAVEATQHRINYFLGNDESRWQADIPTAKAVLYKDLYKNIDLRVYGIEKQIEYDWIIHRGGNPEDIRFQYKNVKKTRIDKIGNLVITTKFGKLKHKKPVSYQRENVGVDLRVCPADNTKGKRIPVNSVFKNIGKNTYGFKVEEYDKTKTLVIDPVVTLEYSTYLGGSAEDSGYAIAIDNSGSAYVTGFTMGTDFPTLNPYQTDPGDGQYDVFITKLSASGNSLLYSTYLGGNSNEYGLAIEVDSAACAYITGRTVSASFPTRNAYQNSLIGGPSDAFVTKLSPAGNSLVFSTFLGGSGDDVAFGIEVDQSHNIYLTGETYSTDFPTKNAYQNSLSGINSNAFVTKLSATGNSLVFSTFLGGSGSDWGEDICLDVYRNAYVTGSTGSVDFPTKNASQGSYGGGWFDGFVTKLSSGGNSLIYSTFLGGSAKDQCYDIVVDSNCNAYLTGETNSIDFPTLNPTQSVLQGPCDAFVAKISSTGNSLGFSTYLGGTDEDMGLGIDLDSSNNIYIAGETESTDFPVKNAYQSTFGGSYDGFVTKLSSSGKSFIYSTYLGGKGWDALFYRFDIAVDQQGNAYVAGFTDSTDFPTKKPFQGVSGGGDDAFVTKLSFTSTANIITVTYPNGGESLTVGSEPNITWTTSIDLPGVKIEYSTNNGSSWNTIISSTGNDWSHPWKVPNKPSSTCLVRISDSSNSSTYDVSDSVFSIVSTSSSPTIIISRNKLSFGYAKGGSVPGSQNVFLSSTGGLLNWKATADVSWLGWSPYSGIGSAALNVGINPAGLPTGTHTGTISINDPSATNSPKKVNVTLTVYSAGSTSQPFGNFATPTNGANVSSSIPVTGWVLDDVEVASVKIYNGPNYVGDAVFVEGARPDVEAAYPGYPKNYQAGWGYMMLTNFLPGGGNGTYTLFAKAVDLEGHQVTLGSKTIHVNNAGAVKPFGAIDTPVQGGWTSGSSFINWGWVLTPQPNIIPTSGSTIDVWVDGVNLGHPHYNMYRKDIADKFPGYANSNGAIGYFSLDTTAYTIGVHTIQWTAKDSAGNTDGIGSRYFTIVNTGTDPAPEGKVSVGSNESFGLREELLKIPSSQYGSLFIQRGYNRQDKPIRIDSGKDNLFKINIKELDRIVIYLRPDPQELWGDNTLSGFYRGYLLSSSKIRPLPAGSFLDNRRGIFYWLPGPGYLGNFNLLFISKDEDGKSSKIMPVVSIEPRY